MKSVCFSNTICEIRHEIQVTLLPSRRAYLRYNRSKYIDVETKQPCSGAGTAAKCFTFSAEAIASGDPFAELVFYHEQFTVDSIAHEVSHVLVRLFAEENRSLAEIANEELFASLHGKLTAAVVLWRDESL